MIAIDVHVVLLGASSACYILPIIIVPYFTNIALLCASYSTRCRYESQRRVHAYLVRPCLAATIADGTYLMEAMGKQHTSTRAGGVWQQTLQPFLILRGTQSHVYAVISFVCNLLDSHPSPLSSTRYQLAVGGGRASSTSFCWTARAILFTIRLAARARIHWWMRITHFVPRIMRTRRRTRNGTPHC